MAEQARPVLKVKKIKLTPPKPRQPTLPLGPYLDADRKVTPNGLRAVELLAAFGAPQSKIAAALGLPLAQFRKRLAVEDGANELRLTWERGRAELEFELSSALLKQAKSGQTIATLFYLKNMGWSDTPQAPSSNGLTIVLPGAMSREDYLRSIQQPLPQLEVLPDNKEDRNG